MLAQGVPLLISNNHHSSFRENVGENSRISNHKSISLSQTTVNQTIPNYLYSVYCLKNVIKIVLNLFWTEVVL